MISTSIRDKNGGGDLQSWWAGPSSLHRILWLVECSRGRRWVSHALYVNSLIIIDPKICSGKPVIRGSRIMVKNILGMVAGGHAMDQILNAYPELTREMVQAALEIDNNKIRVRKVHI